MKAPPEDWQRSVADAAAYLKERQLVRASPEMRSFRFPPGVNFPGEAGLYVGKWPLA
jgi:hypothetical protein